ncbi:hypothetical protein ACFQJC_06230 [Haloferax namakaokahaiae]|uniref:CbaC protein n=1 Tax=Haloferax namakaokahaiae TaxID=1748331 RepID=A0ABD5ZD22_9EURY
MQQDSPKEDRLWALVLGLLLVTMPAITLVTAYAVLIVTQNVILDRLTLVELVELYVVELVAFAVFSYALFRLARFAWDRHDATFDRTATTDGERTQAVDSVEKDGS